MQGTVHLISPCGDLNSFVVAIILNFSFVFYVVLLGFSSLELLEEAPQVKSRMKFWPFGCLWRRMVQKMNCSLHSF